MPSSYAVYNAMATDDNFQTVIARARELQQDAETERMIALADSANSENWQVVKLQIWARQWRAAKLAPKKYGEKQTVDQNVTMKDDITDTEAARRVALLLDNQEVKGDDTIN